MTKSYNHTLYLNLLHSCKIYGYKKLSKGKPSLKELTEYIYANINHRTPIVIKPTRKYDNKHYKQMVSLARQNGFIYRKVGMISVETFTDFLIEKNIELPEDTGVINQHRLEFSQCKNSYSRLVWRAKILGYRHASLGVPTIEQLNDYIRLNS